VVVLAVVLAAAAAFGVWATVAGKSGVFVVGVCLLLLVAVIAVVGLFVWTRHPQDTELPSTDMIMVPMPLADGFGQASVTMPLRLVDVSPEPEPVVVDPLAELEALWAAEPDGVPARVLELMSVASAAGIRRELLYAAGQAGLLGGEAGAEVDPEAVAGAVAQLAERSLLSVTLDGQVISADRPAMRAVRDRLAEQDRLVSTCRAAATVLEARCEALPGSPDRLAVLDVSAQVRALRDVVAGLPDEPDAELAEALLRLRGWALYHMNAAGQARQAIVIGEPLVDDLERELGPDDPTTLAARNNLANAYQAAGRTDEAVALHEQVLADRERVLGPDHPHTEQSRNNLAAAQRAAGRADEAAENEQAAADSDAVTPQEQTPSGLGPIVLHEQVLANLEEELGPEHPDTLAARNNLALAYQAAGRTDEAIALHEQALAERERVLGPDHPGTLNSRSNLAVAYQAAGRTDEAVALHEQVLADRERVLGPDHPDTLATRNNLANAYRVAGR
jgi:tetratricopeptide (TPR) repeat protein